MSEAAATVIHNKYSWTVTFGAKTRKKMVLHKLAADTHVG